MAERELTRPIDIADRDGRLVREAVGWARHPILGGHLPPGLARRHVWHYWCVTCPAGALTLLVADVGFAGVALVSFQDFAARAPVEHAAVRRGGYTPPLPEAPRGDVSVHGWRLNLALRHHGDDLVIEADARTLFGRRLVVDLTVLRPPAHETLNVLVPWDETRFQLTSKQQALPARGVVRVDGRAYAFGGDDSFACLDFGRGRWPTGIRWHWAFAAGRRDGRTLGLNLGGTWTDGTGVTESGFVLDGRVHKIADDVAFEYDPRRRLEPWRIHTRGSERVALRFTPMRERSLHLPLGVVGLELHQLMGHFEGTVVGDSGERIAVQGLIGLAESVRGHWP